MENHDNWLALDKLYHIIFCFSLTFFFSLIASLTRHSILRRYSVWFGSIASLSAGAAKEAADEIGFFNSAGASVKDAVADLAGVLIAAIGISLYRYLFRMNRESRHVSGVSMV